VVDAMAPVCLLHREHGGTGIAAGLYVVRRQRELIPPPAPVLRLQTTGHRGTPRASSRRRPRSRRRGSVTSSI